MSVAKYLKKFDIYRKVENEELTRVQTTSGAILSLSCLVICIILVIGEFLHFRKIDVKNELSVDKSLEETFDIFFDFTLPNIQCRYLTLEVQDKSGVQQTNIKDNIWKHEIDRFGNNPGRKALIDGTYDSSKPFIPTWRRRNNTEDQCLPCGDGGDPDECCNNCDALLCSYYNRGLTDQLGFGTKQCEGLKKFEYHVRNDRGGCNIHGKVTVHRCQGMFQIVPVSTFTMPATNVQQATRYLEENFNITHTVDHFSFGQGEDTYANAYALKHVDKIKKNDVLSPEVSRKVAQKMTKMSSDGDESVALAAPLDSKTVVQTDLGSFNYFAKIVPTTIKPLSSTASHSTYQFSVTQYFEKFVFGETKPPGIHIWYDLSPIRVTLTETRPSFLPFFTSLCAIIGGVYTVAGIIDSLFFKIHTIRGKQRIGKAV
ncbi:putative endoplasmic reticulum vesicle transporter [Monocercomonoides exilis]|uniref:putative endoplasmic reticulum vesicle transporter n=1 Tax=Monocercomonoides exilis TaxID=2049356 RepID=UPI003559B08F|nr:putative endoplasmic reticulum vesicle transporter [Monocercomonoides exilis]|eukprot:MONOS_718.1-p1 / transcript=MONOS_718.1 / gene=MONOS_718 / organism=Monocercomonoides_exilis_PA203 / gene_product=AGAP012144-PA / transcript_product=AGAP012144-PA / location=Mono_scaffold00012:68831-71603(+) / protein_length=427 / sequence_SO=supercontig / SO=protein_coding / is_pseudo=false